MRSAAGALIVVTLLFTAWGSVRSEDPAQQAGEPAASAGAEPAGSTSPEADAELLTRKRRVTAGMLTIALVTATGLALLALIVLGGTATRRTLRRPEGPDEPRRPSTTARPDSPEGGSAESPPESEFGPPPLAPETGLPDETRE